MGNFSKGYLVAKSFSTGADSAAAQIKVKHQKDIVLSKLDEYSILHPMTEQERENYS
jgi:hypothetical protein